MKHGRRFPFHGEHILLKHWTTAVLFSALVAFHPRAQAVLTCQQVFLPQVSQAQSGAAFLHERDSKLHTSPFVEKYKQREKRQSGFSLQKPADKITAWLKALEAISQKAGQSEWALQNIKDIFHRQYLVKSGDIPESYYQLQVRLARERGHGDITLNDTQKQQLAQTLIQDQKKSLDPWIEYFVSQDSASYPMWTKFWMLTNVTKLSKFHPEKASFDTRGKDTVAPFPELNREAVAMVVDLLLKKIQKDSLAQIQDPQLIQVLKDTSFNRLYGYALDKVGGVGTGKFLTNEGRWVRYPQGSDPTPLVNSLEGKNTGWCTAGMATAQSQLANGDFYVYYSMDGNSQPTQPRIAIRMQGSDISEVRGVAANQNMDDQIMSTPILSNKLQEFGDKAKAYEKKDHDMRLLTEIERKTKIGIPLSQSDLLFLYELNGLKGEIQGFGYGRDPRIEEIRSQRDLKSDFATLFSGPNAIKEFHGDLSLSQLTSAQGLVLPQILRGNLYLSSLESAEGLQFPEIIHGGILLSNLTWADGLRLPKVIDGNVIINSLTSSKGLQLPESVGGDLYLQRLKSAEGVKFPKTIGGDLCLNDLTSTKGLQLPEIIGGNLTLNSLASPIGLQLPKAIGGGLVLSRLVSIKGLKLPDAIGRGLYLNNLESTENVVVPKMLKGKIFAPDFHGKFEYK